MLSPLRRGILIRHLLPALNDDSAAAESTARKLFHQFAIKLIDLWRYEAGSPIDNLLGPATGWKYFEQARAKKRGVLVITCHLGNWEFGGPLLRRRGITLQVVTLAEPGRGFTRLRQASRARWQIETLVIGDDPFEVLEIIKRLESGATVALLVDRPPAATGVTVQLFGRPFNASIAAAELARASGCVLLPVYLPFRNGVYEAHILGEIEYDRAALRDRPARQQLTQKIMNVFEPIIDGHLDQWYHFVPLWPNDKT
jgi:KDO2-lipid IV(A) lauroyltransferase